MFELKKFTANHICIVLLGICTSGDILAQTPSSDAASASPLGVIPETGQIIPAPQIDRNAPGLSYTPERMAERIMEIAEGPIPSRDELEKEFGFKFWKLYVPASEKMGGSLYFATAASPPFEVNKYPQYENIRYFIFNNSVSINFKLYSALDFPYESNIKYCLSPELFKSKLIEWGYHKIVRYHIEDMVFYTINKHGINRNLSFSPEKLGEEPCVRLAGVTYSVAGGSEN